MFEVGVDLRLAPSSDLTQARLLCQGCFRQRWTEIAIRKGQVLFDHLLAALAKDKRGLARLSNGC